MIQLNYLLLAFLIAFFLRAGTHLLLNRLNISYLRKYGSTVPEVFRDTIDQEKLQKISSYTIESSRFGILSIFASQIFFLALLLFALLPWLI